MCYRTGTLTRSWQVVHIEQASVSYFNSDLHAIIESNASCRDDAEATPLETLTNHLLLGYTERVYRSTERVALTQREALHTVVEAKLDGVPMEYEIYVMKKDGCLYDIVYVASPDHFAEGAPDFDRFARGVHAISSPRELGRHRAEPSSCAPGTPSPPSRSARPASSGATGKFTSLAWQRRASSFTSGTSSLVTRCRLTASKRGCSAESFTEMPGRSGSGRLFAARPMASIALA